MAKSITPIVQAVKKMCLQRTLSMPRLQPPIGNEESLSRATYGHCSGLHLLQPPGTSAGIDKPALNT